MRKTDCGIYVISMKLKIKLILLFIVYIIYYQDLRFHLFKNVVVKEMRHDIDLLVWLFEPKHFLFADFLEQARAKIKTAFYR